MAKILTRYALIGTAIGALAAVVYLEAGSAEARRDRSTAPAWCWVNFGRPVFDDAGDYIGCITDDAFAYRG